MIKGGVFWPSLSYRYLKTCLFPPQMQCNLRPCFQLYKNKHHQIYTIDFPKEIHLCMSTTLLHTPSCFIKCVIFLIISKHMITDRDLDNPKFKSVCNYEFMTNFILMSFTPFQTKEDFLSTKEQHGCSQTE